MTLDLCYFGAYRVHCGRTSTCVKGIFLELAFIKSNAMALGWWPGGWVAIPRLVTLFSLGKALFE